MTPATTLLGPETEDEYFPTARPPTDATEQQSNASSLSTARGRQEHVGRRTAPWKRGPSAFNQHEGESLQTLASPPLTALSSRPQTRTRWDPEEMAQLRRAMIQAQSCSAARVIATGPITTRHPKQIENKLRLLKKTRSIKAGRCCGRSSSSGLPRLCAQPSATTAEEHQGRAGVKVARAPRAHIHWTKSTTDEDVSSNSTRDMRNTTKSIVWDPNLPNDSRRCATGFFGWVVTGVGSVAGVERSAVSGSVLVKMGS
eukprot:GHVT01031294.1.p1 GENE.GHVT01031294.1~~GHVT01031294.1.p1  ORF type:complete len:257 (+),score=34.50 GHVT01031294.1:98-868(+)